MSSVFSTIYKRNLWHGHESRSGPGSGFAATHQAAAWLVDLCAELRIESVLDVGCGDSVWMPPLPGYVGIDVAPEAVELARTYHPERDYAVCDARLGLPHGRWGLVFLRDVLQHLSFADGLAVLANVRASGAAWMVASTYTGPSERYPDPLNTDIETGDCYCNDLTLPPFSLPVPLRTLRDGWDYTDGTKLRDGAKWLGLWDL